MGLSMGGNAWRVLTKLSPCRQSPVSVAYYLPLCVSFVTKCWAIDQPVCTYFSWHMTHTLRLGMNISIQ